MVTIKTSLFSLSDTVSRSAIFCAAVNAIERFKADNIVDIYQIVKCLRLQKTQAIMSVVSTLSCTLKAYCEPMYALIGTVFSHLLHCDGLLRRH